MHQGVLVISLGARTTGLGAPVTSLAALRLVVEQCGKNLFFGNPAGAPGMLHVCRE
jgi:hypothetical protein